MRHSGRFAALLVLWLTLLALAPDAEARARRHKRRSSRIARKVPRKPKPAIPVLTPPVRSTAARPVAPLRTREQRYRHWSMRPERQRVSAQSGKPGFMHADARGASGLETNAVETRVQLVDARARRVALRATGGFGQVTSLVESDGSGDLSHYELSTPCAAVGVRAQASLRLGRSAFHAAIDAGYQGRRATKGVRYVAPNGQSELIPLTTHVMDGGLSLSRRVSRVDSQRAGLRLGYRYAFTTTPELTNLARLPREALHGVSLGAWLDLPRVLEPVGLHATIDVLLPGPLGRFAQSDGLADGTSARPLALFGGLVASVPLTRRLQLEAGGRFEWLRVEFSGASSRQPGVTSATRTDTALLALVGLTVSL